MQIDITCPHCAQPLKIASEHAGKIGTCNNCGNKFTVPIPEAQISGPGVTANSRRLAPIWIGVGIAIVAVLGAALYVNMNSRQEYAGSPADAPRAAVESTPLPLALPQPANQAATSSLKAPRTVTFPSDRVVGTVFMRDEGAPLWGRALGPARGPVTVPEGKEVGLWVTKRDSADLAFLQAFAANDLDYLILFHPSMTERQLHNIEHLTGLKMLLVEYCGLRDAWLRSFQDLTHLEFLGLAGTKVTDAGISTLSSLRRLEGLSLAGTKITHRGIQSLTSSSALENIFLSASALTPSMVDVLKEIPSLRGLYIDTDVVIHGEFFSLSDGPASPDTIVLLRNLTQLENLFFRGKLHDDSLIQPLSQLTFLKAIEFQNTSTTTAGRNELRRALPNCTITPS